MDCNFSILMATLFAFETCASPHYLDAERPFGARKLTRTVRNVQMPAYLSPHEVIIYKGQTQHIRCPSYREDEPVSLVFWFKEEQLLARYAHPEVGSSYSSSAHYQMSHSHDLIIRNAEMRDKGRYVCSVLPRASASQRRESVSVTVLAHFPRFKEAAYLTASQAYVQRNQTYHIQCPSYREGESVSLVFWFKGGQLLARYADPAVGTSFISSHHYLMSSSHGLVIQRVGNQEADGGDYVCSVLPRGTAVQRKRTVRLTVLDSEFPVVEDSRVENKTSLNLERGRSLEIPCPTQRMHGQAATLYWSLGNGETSGSSIIGVKFSGGEALVTNKYCGDFNITGEGWLVFSADRQTSLFSQTSRFWCHMFWPDQGLSSAYYEITMEAPGSTMKNATSGNDRHTDEQRPRGNRTKVGELLGDSADLLAVKTRELYVLYVLVVLLPLIIGIVIFVKMRKRRNRAGEIGQPKRDGPEGSNYESKVNQRIAPKEGLPMVATWTEKGGVRVVENCPQGEPAEGCGTFLLSLPSRVKDMF